jgi:hypothetical protein
MEANFQSPDEIDSQDAAIEVKVQSKEINLAESNIAQAKLSYGAFSRLARILIDIAQNSAPVQEQQNANSNKQ